MSISRQKVSQRDHDLTTDDARPANVDTMRINEAAGVVFAEMLATPRILKFISEITVRSLQDLCSWLAPLEDEAVAIGPPPNSSMSKAAKRPLL